MAPNTIGRKTGVNSVRYLLPCLLLCAGTSALAKSAEENMLMAHLHFGEDHRREDVVEQVLERLDMIAPEDPEVMAAHVRYLSRRGRIAEARSVLEQLTTLAPGSPIVRSTQIGMLLIAPEGRQKLQQARLLAASGRAEDAVSAYRTLFGGTFPSDALALEYWLVVSRTKGGTKVAIEHLEAMLLSSPDKDDVRLALARLLFSVGRDSDAFAVLERASGMVQARSDAADLWFSRIRLMEVSDKSIEALKHFLQVFKVGSSVIDARALLVSEEKQWSQPAFRAKAMGVQHLMKNELALAMQELQRAVAQSPNDGEAVGDLGVIYSRRGMRARAVENLQRAIADAPDSPNRSKWDSLLNTNRYWLLINEGDTALSAGNYVLAQLKYQRAARLDGRDSYAPLGLGDVAAAKSDWAAAEQFYQLAIRLDARNVSAVRALAKIYRRRSVQDAEHYIRSLSPRQRQAIHDIESGILDDQQAEEAANLESHGYWEKASQVNKRRLLRAPDDVWVSYHLARDMSAAGKRIEADGLLRRLVVTQPKNASAFYAYALYLSATDRDGDALALLHDLPASVWTDSLQNIQDRLNTTVLLSRARGLRAQGEEAQGVKLLESALPSDRINLELSDWAQQDGHWEKAASYDQHVLAHSPLDFEARLSLAESRIGQGARSLARQDIAMLLRSHSVEVNASLGFRRRVARALMQVGDITSARVRYAELEHRADLAPVSMDRAMAQRDVARFYAQENQPSNAMVLYRKAMVSSGIAYVVPSDNVTFTRLMRTTQADEWLSRGIRSDAAKLYRQQNVNVTLDYDYWGMHGTRGYSSLTAATGMMEANAPLAGGTALLRADFVTLDAGSFTSGPDGSYHSRWASCPVGGCLSVPHQGGMGVGLAAGWFNDRWQVDVGTTPIGLKVLTLAGGGTYRGDIGPLSFALNVHHRPINNSLLSFGGQRDPNTGKTWGGVRATGAIWNLSYDTGGRNGVWASPGADLLAGQNVEENWRFRWMGGYYYKIVNERNRRLSIGFNNMYWHYAHDVSGYTLGQGGYFSPQKYLSFSVPVWWRQRTRRWSWEVGASLSWSISDTSSNRRYPLRKLVGGLNPLIFTDRDARNAGGSSSGLGYTVQGVIERRLSPHWSVGAGIDVQEARNYTPSHAFVFLRYYQKAWEGDMDLPPQPLIPEAQW